jgi:hypothetical protein
MLPLTALDVIKSIVTTNKGQSTEWLFAQLLPIVVPIVRLSGSQIDTHDIEKAIRDSIASFTRTVVVLNDDAHDGFDDKWAAKLDRSNWEYWPSLYRYLGEFKIPPRSPGVLASLDQSSELVLSQLGSPSVAHQRFGLVIGYVQSGKTENFTALVAKAADAGYKLVIILSGIDDEIRGQTQGRIRTHIWGAGDDYSKDGVKYPKRRWNELTGLVSDFYPPPSTANNVLGDDRPTCMVIKKNGAVLRRLKGWLSDASVNLKESLPVLVIDDEADQASPNVASNDDPDERPTVINRLIREILTTFDKSRYVAYTATPFANFFINAETLEGRFGNDLYPRDFIVSLPSPSDYVGSADIYGLPPGVLRDGKEVQRLDVCRICADDPSQINAVGAESLNGLKSAIRSFVLGTAVQLATKGNDRFPSTMLVHASHLNVNHENHREAVDAILDDMRAALGGAGRNGLLRAIESLYKGELVKSWSHCRELGYPVPEALPAFDVIVEALGTVLSDGWISVRVVNSQADSIPKWEGEGAVEPYLKSILIGGNLLSRGLTMPNLLTSYFMRKPEQADTMLQMARWLGYRRSVAYLMSVYSIQACHADMSSIAAAEQDIRNQIAEMRRQGKKPVEFQFVVRIRQGLIPTRTNAMRNADQHAVSSSHAGELLETFCFNENDMAALRVMTENNLALLKSSLTAPGVVMLPGAKPGVHVFRASGREALDFIEQLSLPGDELSLGVNPNGVNNKSLLVDYVRRRMDVNELNVWDFVIQGRSRSSGLRYEDFSLLPGLSITPIQRGRDLNGATRLPRLKSLGVGLDEYEATLGEERYFLDCQLSGIKDASTSNGSLIRRLRSPRNGRIFVYPISKYSNQPGYAPGERSESALFLEANLQDAPEVIWGFAISLPGSDAADQEAIDGWVNRTGRTV